MQLLCDYALQFVGTPYKYSGNNPVDGLDCSGLVCELLRSIGMIGAHEDLSAQQLYERLKKQDPVINLRTFGAIAFFGKSLTEITHVAFVLGGGRLIEAGGGDRLTLTRDDAAKKNAFVRIRPIEFRSDLLITLRPQYPFDLVLTGNVHSLQQGA